MDRESKIRMGRQPTAECLLLFQRAGVRILATASGSSCCLQLQLQGIQWGQHPSIASDGVAPTCTEPHTGTHKYKSKKGKLKESSNTGRGTRCWGNYNSHMVSACASDKCKLINIVSDKITLNALNHPVVCPCTTIPMLKKSNGTGLFLSSGNKL